jgi:RNA polymerase sigma-70 factor, ECF subfamily
MDEATRSALAAGAGDHHAAEQLVRQTQADVWRWCAHLGDRDRAEDLTQETYLRALRSLPGFRAESSIRTWLFQIARRVVADDIANRRRRRRGTVSSYGPPEGGAHQAGVADHAGSVALGALVSALEPGRREAFVLTQVLGYSYLEAAALSDCPVGTIRSRVARARSDLITWLDEGPAADRRLQSG